MARILVVDDNDNVRTMLRMILEHAGYDVHDAPNGKVALEMCRKELPDLVITDILMPEKDGFETIMDLWRDYPEVKVIAISGSGGPETAMNLTYAKLFGAIRVFAKPVHQEELLSAVRELIGAESLSDT